MSIRIHKALGYGLSDVERDDRGRIVDPRFNREVVEDIDRFYDIQTEFLSLFKSRNRDVEGLRRLGGSAGLGKSEARRFSEILDIKPNGNLMVHDPVFLLIPANYAGEWFRRDDSLDYYTHRPESIENEVREIVRGIWPYERVLRLPLKRMPVSFYESEDDVDLKRLMVAGSLDFDDYELALLRTHATNALLHEHLRQHWTWQIPPMIRMFAKYSNVFVDYDSTIESLRPMLSTWWS